MRVRRFLIVLLVCVGALAAVASGEEETPTAADGSGDDAAAAEGEPQTFTVGQPVALGDYEIVVHAVTDPLPPALVPPAPGTHYVAVDAEVTNKTDQPTIISSLAQFEVQDATNAAHSITITDHGLPSLDGEAPAGGARRGTMVFAIPDGASGLRLNFIGDLFSSGQATIQLT